MCPVPIQNSKLYSSPNQFQEKDPRTNTATTRCLTCHGTLSHVILPFVVRMCSQKTAQSQLAQGARVSQQSSPTGQTASDKIPVMSKRTETDWTFEPPNTKHRREETNLGVWSDIMELPACMSCMRILHVKVQDTHRQVASLIPLTVLAIVYFYI